MSFRLLSISSMYEGYLKSFYEQHHAVESLRYKENLRILLGDTAELAASYVKYFRLAGIEADVVISNDEKLQNKWEKEHCLAKTKPHDTLFSQIECFNPDVLWIENLSFVSGIFLKFVKEQIPAIKLIVASHCAPFNAKVIESMKAVDLVITCNPGLQSAIERMGKKCHLVYHGFDTALLQKIKMRNDDPVNDFVFSGSLISGGDFHNERIRLIENILKEGINIELYANVEKEYRIRLKRAIYNLSVFQRMMKLQLSDGSFLRYGKAKAENYSASLLSHHKAPVFGSDMLSIFSNTRVVLNLHPGIAGEYAGNMRMFEVTAAGSCLLTDNKKNMPDLFDIHNEVVVYDNSKDCIEKAKWLLEHENERKKIAMAGQKKTLECHSLESRCNDIIEIINKELAS